MIENKIYLNHIYQRNMVNKCDKDLLVANIAIDYKKCGKTLSNKMDPILGKRLKEKKSFIYEDPYLYLKGYISQICLNIWTANCMTTTLKQIETKNKNLKNLRQN
jgi:hypothetical protein